MHIKLRCPYANNYTLICTTPACMSEFFLARNHINPPEYSPVYLPVSLHNEGLFSMPKKQVFFIFFSKHTVRYPPSNSLHSEGG